MQLQSSMQGSPDYLNCILDPMLEHKTVARGRNIHLSLQRSKTLSNYYYCYLNNYSNCVFASILFCRALAAYQNLLLPFTLFNFPDSFRNPCKIESWKHSFKFDFLRFSPSLGHISMCLDYYWHDHHSHISSIL